MNQKFIVYNFKASLMEALKDSIAICGIRLTSDYFYSYFECQGL